MFEKLNEIVRILDMSENRTVWEPNENKNVRNPNVRISDNHCISYFTALHYINTNFKIELCDMAKNKFINCNGAICVNLEKCNETLSP